MTQVLVVDDSLSVRKALEAFLRPLSYNVRMADSGEAALVALGAQRADLVIADVLMTGMTGFELCEEIRADPKHAGTAVILISGIVSDEDRARARAMGAAGLVRKPFRADDLLPLVRGALSGPGEGGGMQEGSAQTGAQPSAPQPSAPAPQDPKLGSLLEVLLSKQGVLSAALVDGNGQVLVSRGDALPNAAVLGHYFRFFSGATRVFGVHLDDAPQSTLMEFGRRALLLSPFESGHTLVVMLRDAGAATVAKFVVKGQRAQLESALQSR